MLKPLLLVPALLLLGFKTLPISPVPQAGSAAAKPGADTSAHAKSIYQRDCALCHGESGNGKTDLAHDMQLTLSDWTDPKSLDKFTDDQLFDLIRKGKGDKMPPEDPGRAKNDEVRLLINYIRGFSKNPPAAAPEAAPAAAPAPGTN